MSIRAASKSSLSTRSFAGNVPNPGVGEWVRHPAWLALTTPTENEEKFVGLHAVWPDSNFVSLSAAGNYTVDWGDGTVENYSSGVQSYHEYSYSDADLANTNGPVTFTASSDTVNRTAHGFSNGMRVTFYNLVTTTGITEGQVYYVVNATADTLQVSSTVGGSAIDLVNDGSATLLPYKQALVVVTPQAGQQLTVLNLHLRHNKTNLQGYDSGFLDIAISGQYLKDLRIGVVNPGSSTQTVYFNALERFNLVRSDLRQLEYLLSNCSLLRNLVNLNTSTAEATSQACTFTDTGDLVTQTAHGFRDGDSVIFTSITSTTGISFGTRYFVRDVTSDTYKVAASYGGTALALTTNGSGVAVRGTSMANMFSNCYSLTSVPLFNTASVTSMTGMFSSSTALLAVPLLNTANVILISSMFSSCTALTSVPLFNTVNVITMNSMFFNCYSLASVPLFNTAVVTNMVSMFSNCYSLASVPLFNTAAVTNMGNMFYNCYSLTSVPLFNTVNVISMSSMLQGCYSLASVPLFNTAAVTNMASMFYNCYSLASVPLFNTAAVTNMGSMFSGCRSLTSVPALNAAAVTTGNFANAFSSCASLATLKMTGMKFSFSVASNKLSKSALETLFANIGVASGGSQTLTITGNHGIDTAVTKVVNTTAQSATVSVADTSGLSVGMIVTGTGTGFFTISTISADVTTNEFTLANHGLPNGTRVAFPGLSTVTGLTIDTIYYVVNATTNTFQVAATAGGDAIDLTGSNSASVFLRYECYIASINTNVSITLTTPAASTQTSTTLTFRLLDSGPAWLRSWTVTY